MVLGVKCGGKIRHHAAKHPAGLQRSEHFFQGAARFRQVFKDVIHRHHAQAAGRDVRFLKLHVHHENAQFPVRVVHAFAGEFDAARRETFGACVQQKSTPAAAHIKPAAARFNEISC